MVDSSQDWVNTANEWQFQHQKWSLKSSSAGLWLDSIVWGMYCTQLQWVMLKIHRQRKRLKTEEENLLEINTVKVSKRKHSAKKDTFATYKSLMISCRFNKALKNPNKPKKETPVAVIHLREQSSSHGKIWFSHLVNEITLLHPKARVRV